MHVLALSRLLHVCHNTSQPSRALFLVATQRACALLQFYQEIPYQEINEEYLWEQRLEPLLTYLSGDHRTKVREALSLGYDAHIQQKRKSGEPFITHPVEVTRILAELQMDHESLIAGVYAIISACQHAIQVQEHSSCIFSMYKAILTQQVSLLIVAMLVHESLLVSDSRMHASRTQHHVSEHHIVQALAGTQPLPVPGHTST